MILQNERIETMSRKAFLTAVAMIAATVGGTALFGPEFLLENVKQVQATPVAVVMTRTVGVLLITIALLNFLVRNHRDTPSLRAILIADLALQLMILPIDPLAYATGTFSSVSAFLPNTMLHLVLAVGFAVCLYNLRFRQCATVPADRHESSSQEVFGPGPTRPRPEAVRHGS